MNEQIQFVRDRFCSRNQFVSTRAQLPHFFDVSPAFLKETKMPQEPAMTPKMASLLMGWATGDRDSVLGAALSTFLNDEVHCTIDGDNDQIVTVRMYGPDNIGRSDELVDFVLAIIDSEGEPEFQSVMFDIRCFIHVARPADRTVS